jgi:hypothetical protein
VTNKQAQDFIEKLGAQNQDGAIGLHRFLFSIKCQAVLDTTKDNNQRVSSVFILSPSFSTKSPTKYFFCCLQGGFTIVG